MSRKCPAPGCNRWLVGHDRMCPQHASEHDLKRKVSLQDILSTPSKVSAFKDGGVASQALLTNGYSIEVVSGFMEKQATTPRRFSIGRLWQKRYFALEGEFLKYYSSSAKEKMKGAIDLNRLAACYTMLDTSTKTPDTYCLTLEVLDMPAAALSPEAKKTVCKLRSNKAEVQKWCNALTEHIELMERVSALEDEMFGEASRARSFSARFANLAENLGDIQATDGLSGKVRGLMDAASENGIEICTRSMVKSMEHLMQAHGQDTVMDVEAWIKEEGLIACRDSVFNEYGVVPDGWPEPSSSLPLEDLFQLVGKVGAFQRTLASEESRPKDVDIILVGNPGVGKSTILRTVSGLDFSCGVHFGEGLTKGLEFMESREMGGVRFADTPGTMALPQATGDTEMPLATKIAEAFHHAAAKGATVKLIFCVTVENNHVTPVDCQTIKRVLQLVNLGARYIDDKTNKFGIIVNQIGDSDLAFLHTTSPGIRRNSNLLEAQLQSATGFQTDHILYLPSTDVEDDEAELGNLPTLNGMNARHLLEWFIFEAVVPLHTFRVEALEKVMAANQRTVDCEAWIKEEGLIACRDSVFNEYGVVPDGWPEPSSSLPLEDLFQLVGKVGAFQRTLASEESRPKDVDIILVGNPGVGKSTILRTVSGLDFSCGVHFGEGLTKGLEFMESREMEGVRFADTPGLSDVALRQQAADAIVRAFKDAARARRFVKLVFCITIEGGRVRPEDSTTIREVLQSLQLASGVNKNNKFGLREVLQSLQPAWGVSKNNKFGLIVNKLGRKAFEALHEESLSKESNERRKGSLNRMAVKESLFDAIGYKTDHILYIPRDENADGARDNALGKLPMLNGMDARDLLTWFIFDVVSTLSLSGADKIQSNEEKLKNELKRNAESHRQAQAAQQRNHQQKLRSIASRYS